MEKYKIKLIQKIYLCDDATMVKVLSYKKFFKNEGHIGSSNIPSSWFISG